MLHRFPQQRLVRLAENLIGQLHRANYLSAEIQYVNVCHRFLFQARSTRSGSKSSFLSPCARQGAIVWTASPIFSCPWPSSKPSADQPFRRRQIRDARAAGPLPWKSAHIHREDPEPLPQPSKGSRPDQFRESEGSAPSSGPRRSAPAFSVPETHATETTKRQSIPAPGTYVRATSARLRTCAAGQRP